MARRLGGSQQAVSPWLDLARADIPKGRLMLALPGALKVSGHWLLTGEGPRELVAGEEAAYRAGLEEGRRLERERLHAAMATPSDAPVLPAVEEAARHLAAARRAASELAAQKRRRKRG